MCGIIGYVGKKNALSVIINGLERLEYRGYDSCGVAFLKDKKIELLKESGKIENLKKQIDFSISSDLGIGHTRWATHGEPNKNNSHPHKVGRVTIVHNGIIENYIELKSDLIKVGYSFQGETDTEVLCAYIDYLYKNNDISYVMENIKKNVKGSYALAIIFDDKLEKKADKTELYNAIDNAKKEMDLKRDADYRELKTDLKYIREGIDDLKIRLK